MVNSPVATLIAAPPLLAPSQVGRLFSAFPPIDSSDPHIALGVLYERDIQINGTAVWGSNACETAGADKAATEISGEVTGLVYSLFQMAKCRMINEWSSLAGRLSTLFELGEERTIEEAFADALTGGDYGTVSAGPTATNASARSTFAIAEQYIRDQMVYGTILASPEVVTIAVQQNLVVREGDELYTVMGTKVVALPGLGDDLYVTGQIVIWRGPRSEPHQAQTKTTGNYDNEFVVLVERIYTIAVEGDDGAMPIVKWTVNLAL